MNKYTKYFREIAESVRDGSFALRRQYCDSCDRATPFLLSGREPRSIRCMSCRSTAISLAAVRQIRKLQLEPSSSRVYELSYHGAVFRYLRDAFPDFHFSEYFGPPAGGVYVNGVRSEDVQRLSFEDGMFDLVTSTEVFEHVPDYMAGFAEVHRVLKPGGWFVFTIPLFDSTTTEAICELAAGGKLRWLQAEEYHDSQVTGVASVPVFWHHSKDQVVHDLRRVGFGQAELVPLMDFSDHAVPLVIVARR